MKGMENITCSDTTITAILVDGGFYRRRAYLAFGDKSPEERATELYTYCMRHLRETIGGQEVRHRLYRIFIIVALRLKI